ncbi:hypothetical protein ACVWYG_001562 [Pedobacter sp. UYEF25]
MRRKRSSDQTMLMAYLPGTTYENIITIGAKRKVGNETLMMDASCQGKPFTSE